MSDPQVAAVADQIADALTDPSTAWRTSPAGGRVWPQSLAGGAAGIALLHIERARAGRGDWAIAHTWLAAASGDPLSAADNAGLYVGAPALAVAVRAAASTGRYLQTLRQLDEAVVRLTHARLTAAHARIDAGRRPAMREFDLIRGLTGLGSYHLHAHPHHPITSEVLAYLVRLTEPLPAHGDGLPGWWTDVSPNGEPDPEFPGGHGNLGMSHGISSVLALLALSLLHDLPVPGARDALGRICAWIDAWRQGDPTQSPWWPGYLTTAQVRQQRVDQQLRPRPSWCYGVAGTARAQQLAARALGDTTRQRTAENAILAVLRDANQLNRLEGIGLCHGTAGLLQAAARMATDATTPDIAAELPRLAARLVDQLTPALTDATASVDPELLDGAAGAALALNATATAPAWDAILLLA